MFRAQVLIVRRSKLYYTVSGIITPIGVMIMFVNVKVNKELLQQGFCNEMFKLGHFCGQVG
jgi:hypothetical protein